MDRKAFVGKATYNRLVNRLIRKFDLPELEITNEIISPSGRKVLEVVPKKSTLNTSVNRFIYNNSDGEFFLGDGKVDKNKVKITKVLKSLWGIEDPIMLKEMQGLWRSYYVDEIKIGEPAFVYGLEHAGGGTLWNSCMNGKWEYYLGMEKVLKDKLKVVYIQRGDKLMARALLWKVDRVIDVNTGEEFKDIVFMDRRYYADEAYEKALAEFAENRGYWIKKYNTFDSPLDVIDGEGKSREVEMIVKGEGFIRRPLPYMDTFYIVVTDGADVYFSNSEAVVDYVENIEQIFSLRTTDGEPNELELCAGCGSIVDYNEDEYSVRLYSGEVYCGLCAEERLVYCKDIDDYADIDNAERCPYCEHYYYRDINVCNKAIIDGEEVYICDDCANSDAFVWSDVYEAFIEKDDADYCPYCGDYVLLSDEDHVYCDACGKFVCKWEGVVEKDGSVKRICVECRGEE